MSDSQKFWNNSWKQTKYDIGTTSFCKKVIKYLKKVKNKDKLSVLDLGSGYGSDALSFLNGGFKSVTCFDISDIGLEKVKNDSLKQGFKNLETDENICIKDQNGNFKHLFTTTFAEKLLGKYNIISVERMIDEHFTFQNGKQDFPFIDIVAKKRITM